MSNIRLQCANGDSLPMIGLGTWKAKPGEVYEAVKSAIEVGYRHIDCASVYGNETEIGQAIADQINAGTVSRDELWITSKLWCDSFAAEDIKPALISTLHDLQLEYLDLYLMHWPIPLKKGHGMRTADDFVDPVLLPYTDTWVNMNQLSAEGLVRHCGVSNFTVKKLKKLLENTPFKPAVNQVELHPYLQQTDLVNFCQGAGIHLTAYSPLGSSDRPDPLKQAGEPVLLENSVIGEIANELSASAAQVIIAWLNSQGISTIPKSTNLDRQKQNLDSRHLKLSEEQVNKIAEIDLARRYITGEFWIKDEGFYTLGDIWDE